MNLREIANKINEKSNDYEIGKLQSIRKELKGLQTRPGSLIFTDKTIREDWAFHYGGRTEIQFNIGFEDEGFRFGLAFSLEESQTLPDISILFPKVLKLNCFIREEPKFFKNYKMWHWKNEGRSDFSNVKQISEELISSGTFIFFGKIVNINEIDIDEVLKTFDELLYVYKIIETDNQNPSKFEIREKIIGEEFIFNKKPRLLPKSANYTIKEREIDIDIRHSFLQERLKDQLDSEYGENNVSIENSIRGNKIDLVVIYNNEYFFYEVKTGSSPKACVRQAIGQLFEYAYGSGKKNASKIFIASEFPIDNETDIYLRFLREEFKIPIYYKKIEI